MLFLDQATINANPATLEITEGQWSALYLRINGTHSGSYARASVGSILGYCAGIPWLNCDFSHLLDCGNRIAGTMIDTAGTTFDYAVLIPCGVPERGGYIPNTMLVERADKAHLYVPTTSTTTATATLYGIPSSAPSNYILEITEKTDTLGGTCIVKPGRDNVQLIAIWDAATTDPNKVECEWNGKERYQPGWTDGEIYGNMIALVETAVAGHWIDLNPARIPALMRNNDVKITIGGGAGAQTFTFFSAIFTPEKAGLSALKIRGQVKEVIQTQQQRGQRIDAPLAGPFGRR